MSRTARQEFVFPVDEIRESAKRILKVLSDLTELDVDNDIDDEERPDIKR